MNYVVLCKDCGKDYSRYAQLTISVINGVCDKCGIKINNKDTCFVYRDKDIGWNKKNIIIEVCLLAEKKTPATCNFSRLFNGISFCDININCSDEAKNCVFKQKATVEKI